MTPKFKVGDHVRITWRPPFQKKHLFGSDMIDALEREHIIDRVFPPINGRTLPKYRFDYPGLYGVDFFDGELQLLPRPTLVVRKSHLPNI